ncbi:MAG: hypothetical protein HUJ68_02995, partial [Clostridia bacterium]|nr:hypothetical protein [Clostridia bacterium]
TNTDIIKIYLNGKSILTSTKNIGYIEFRCLNEIDNRQVGVPYNISIGGGSLGLRNFYVSEKINEDGTEDVYNYILPIEKYFSGTFIGEIFAFSVTNNIYPYNIIKSNAEYMIPIINNTYNYDRVFYGITNTNDITNFIRLTQIEPHPTALPITQTYNGYGFVVIVYPKKWGELTMIKDQNGFVYYDNTEDNQFSKKEIGQFYLYISDTPNNNNSITYTFS